MAIYGLKTFDANGNVLVNVTSRLSRVRYVYEAAAGETDSIELADLQGLNTVEMSWSINASSVASFPHEVSRTGNTINWVDPSAGTNVASLIIVIIIT